VDKVDRVARPFGLTAAELAAVKRRVAFAGVQDLPDGELASMIERIVPALRQTTAVVAQHDALAQDQAVEAAPLLPGSLRDKLNRALERDHEAKSDGPFGQEAATGEIIVTLAGDRRARFNPTTLVVTPLRVDR
jgi:hypothetical protein